jgi:8-amino-7-oxononanoate synthase
MQQQDSRVRRNLPAAKLVYERSLRSERLAQVRLLQRIGRYPYFSRVGPGAGTAITIEGKTVVNLGSNSYLDLATHPRVIEAACAAARRWGAGVTGSRLLNGNLTLHEELEEELSGFFGREAALVFPTGYTAVLGTISGLLRPDDTMVADEDVHASTLDGAGLVGAKLRKFAHSDPSSLRQRVMGLDPSPVLCAFEGLYSMHGDIAPVDELVEVCDQLSLFTVVDEAHALGTVGAKGAGASESHGSLARVDALVVTFSKSLGSCGGAVIADRPVIDVLRVTSRPFLFTASNTPSAVAAALAGLRLLRQQPELVSRLHERTSLLARMLREAGVPATAGGGPIIAIPVGDDMRTMQAWKMLLNRGVFTNPVISPAVKQGSGLLRLSVMRTHTEAQLETAARACRSLLPLLEGVTGDRRQATPEGREER